MKKKEKMIHKIVLLTMCHADTIRLGENVSEQFQRFCHRIFIEASIKWQQRPD